MVENEKKAELRANRKNIPATRIVAERMYGDTDGNFGLKICTDLQTTGSTRSKEIDIYEGGEFKPLDSVKLLVEEAAWAISKIRGYAFSEKELSSIQLYVEYVYWWRRATSLGERMVLLNVPNFSKKPFLDEEGTLTAENKNLRIRVKVKGITCEDNLALIEQNTSFSQIKNPFIKKYILLAARKEILRRKATALKGKMKKKGVQIPNL